MEYDYKTMLNWLGNRVLGCDYGDNDQPGKIGWRIRHDLLRGPNGERQPAFMYGKSFGEAIIAEIKKAQSAAPINALTKEAVGALKISDLKIMAAPQEPTQHTVSPVSDSPTPAGAAPK